MHHLKLNGLETLDDGESVGNRSPDNHNDQHDENKTQNSPPQGDQPKDIPKEPVQASGDATATQRTLAQDKTALECGIFVRIRRVASGWLYEYYHENADAVDCSVFVPYADTGRDSNPSPEKKKSFMYRIEMNKFTTLNQAMAGFPEWSNIRVRVRRVPGGWIYEYYNVAEDQMLYAVFSPQNNQAHMEQEHSRPPSGDRRFPRRKDTPWPRQSDGDRREPCRDGNNKEYFDDRGRPFMKLGGKSEMWSPGHRGT
jgi:hypothetical protein